MTRLACLVDASLALAAQAASADPVKILFVGLLLIGRRPAGADRAKRRALE